jgi:hypothetical protein
MWEGDTLEEKVVGGRAHDHDVGGFVDRVEAGVLWARRVGIGDDGEPVGLEPPPRQSAVETALFMLRAKRRFEVDQGPRYVQGNSKTSPSGVLFVAFVPPRANDLYLHVGQERRQRPQSSQHWGYQRHHTTPAASQQMSQDSFQSRQR